MPPIESRIGVTSFAFCHMDIFEIADRLAERGLGLEVHLNDFDAEIGDPEPLIQGGVWPRTFGPQDRERLRAMVGTDLPILRMRMRRETRDDHYVNIVPKGLYGDVSDDRNMAEVEGEEADRLTFFLYEEIDAFRRAAERTGLSRRDIEDIFLKNGERLIEGAKEGSAS